VTLAALFPHAMEEIMRSPVRIGEMVVSALLILSLLPVTACASGEVQQTFDVEPGQFLELSFDRIGGTLEIEGWDENRVEIAGRMSGRGWEEDDELEVRQTSSGIRVAPSVRGHDADRVKARLEIKVPRQFDLMIDANTRTRITSVHGEVELSIANAQLELVDVHGEGVVATANGKLLIEGCTLGGEISNVNGRLTIDDSDVKGEVSSVNGRMKISRAPEGIDISSTNGSVDVGMAKDHVRAETTNGSVTIDELEGWIDAETVNGSVRVSMIGDPDGDRSIDIKTVNGNVEIEIPDGFSMDFDIEVKSEDRDRDYEIDSDFELDVESKESRSGKYRLRGTGSVGGGRNQVRIRATNGDVVLRRVSGSR
jgi:DUF4097 and DUF4098 domain-containing protein YvlB